MKLLLACGLALCWLSACVCIKFAPEPPTKEWKSIPEPKIDSDGCCIEAPRGDQWYLPSHPDHEPDDTIDLKKGPHSLMFDDFLNPAFRWKIDHYELYNQWGEVVANIPPNDHHRYVVRGLPPGCYRLRAIGRDWSGQVSKRT